MKHIYWFREVDKDDLAVAGKLGTHLGEMARAGLPLPPGFIVTSLAYHHFLKENDFITRISQALSSIDFRDPGSLMQTSENIQRLILDGRISDNFVREVSNAYGIIAPSLRDLWVDMIPSLPLERPDFPGRLTGTTEVTGDTNVLMTLKRQWSTLFLPAAIQYRHQAKIDHFTSGFATVVRKQIPSDVSGVVTTCDPSHQKKSALMIEAVYGSFRKNLSTGFDQYEVDGSSLEIINKRLSHQTVGVQKIGKEEKEIVLSPKEGRQQKLSDSLIKEVASYAKITEHLHYFPQEISWSVRGGKLYVLQSDPLNVHEKKEETIQPSHLPHVASGLPVSPGIASGPVRILHKHSDIQKVRSGDVIIAQSLDESHLKAIQSASAVIVETGGKMSYASQISRNYGVPAISNVQNATKTFRDGLVITVNGTRGVVQGGGHAQPPHRKNSPESLKTATHVYGNIFDNHAIQYVSESDADGVIAVSSDTIFKEMGIHPKKLIHDGKKKELSDFLISRLEAYCEMLSPRPIVYSLSAMSSYDYQSLQGGKMYEPLEPNPFLGYRGAFRALSEPALLQVELDAIKYIRNKKDYRNLSLLFPFIRTQKELSELKKVVTASGLYRSPSFKIFLGIQVLSTALMLEKYLRMGIDGIVISVDDIAAFVLGVDPSNNEIAHAYHTEDIAVLALVESIIKTSVTHGVPSIIQGKNLSHSPTLLEKSIAWGVEGISVPATLTSAARANIAIVEKKLIS